MTIPVGDKVLIKPDEIGERSVAGIILAPKDKRFVDTGTVLAVSPDFEASVKEGQRVRYSPGTAETLEDETILLSEQHIWYIIN
jgi:co-chaperonin GroES (HSP10)